MPFTPTHIIAILPIYYIARRIPFIALAIGAMSPDAPLFFPFLPEYILFHSFSGIFLFCLPIGLIFFLLFDVFGKKFLLALSPEFIQQRIFLEKRNYRNIAFWLFISLAIIIGAFTHIVWDAFTHDGRWGLAILPFLQKDFSLMGESVSGYKIFQHGSTVIGLPLLFIWGAICLLKTPKNQKADRLKTIPLIFRILCMLSLAIVPVYTWYYLGILGLPTHFHIVQTVKISIGLGVSLFFIYSFMYYIYEHKENYLNKLK